jgi:hypothetical protein
MLNPKFGMLTNDEHQKIGVSITAPQHNFFYWQFYDVAKVMKIHRKI